MKLQILSDLHIDSYQRRGFAMTDIPKTDADIVLVAGDTANSVNGMPWLQQQAQRLEVPLITIAGNHEYFYEDVLSFDSKLQQWNDFDPKTNVGLKFLQCQTIDFADFRIFGCTLWTDYQYQADENTIEVAMATMRDYKNISADKDMFSPQVSVDIHNKHRAWLKQGLINAHAENKTSIVMTHHSVSALSVAEKYADFANNAAFVTDLSEWMGEDWSPKLWLHGHTHEAFDYQLGNTRVVVNPRAYPGEVSSTGVDFAWDKVVEVM